MGTLVASAIDSVRAVRRTETARKEAEFQKAIADGMSYEAQLAFREKQLADESGSQFKDDEFVNTLTSSVSNLKKLNRFNKYRTKYSTTLGELNSGRINEEMYVASLKEMLGGVIDPELRLEIQQDISDGETKLKSYKDTIISNHVKKATYDGTAAVLSSTIQEIRDRRNEAGIAGNEDEVSAYDATLAALNSQLGAVQIEDALADFEVNNSVKSGSPSEKLSALNARLSGSDSTAPVTIGGKRYASAQAYWTATRDNYLAGNGTGLFSNFFKELESKYSNDINGATAKFGFTPGSNIDSIKMEMDTIRSRPEMQPFLSQVDNLQNIAIAAAVKTQADVIISRASYTGDFKGADTALQELGTKYGTDVAGYRLDLGNKLVQFADATRSRTGEDVTLPDILPESDFPTKPGETPAKPGSTPAPETPAAPGATPAPTSVPGASGSYVVRSGDNLSKIASQNGLSLSQLLELNPQYKTNPNLIRPGESIKLSAPKPEAEPEIPLTPPVQPVTPPVVPPAIPGTPPTSTPSPTSTPAATPASVPFTFKKLDNGNVEIYEDGVRKSTGTSDYAKSFGYTG